MGESISVKPSVSRAVREVVEDDLSLQDALQRGYGNISAMARVVARGVEERLGKRVNVQSVVTALKRARVEYARPPPPIREVVAKSMLNVRTDVAKLSVERTKHTLELTRRMLATYQEEFLQVSESISAITLILDRRAFEEVRRMFHRENILEEELDLAAIIVGSPTEIIKTPGCAITFLNRVSRRRLNIEDTVSCYTDTIIVVKMNDVGKAFAALTDLITDARRGKAT